MQPRAPDHNMEKDQRIGERPGEEHYARDCINVRETSIGIIWQHSY